MFNYHHIKKVLDSSVSMPCCASTSLHSTSVEAMQKLLVGRQEGHLACKKTEWWGAGMVICLEWGADLHMAQLMPLPLTVYCFNKIRIGFTCLVPAQPGSRASRGQRAVKRVRARVSIVPLIFILYNCTGSVSSLLGTNQTENNLKKSLWKLSCLIISTYT